MDVAVSYPIELPGASKWAIYNNAGTRLAVCHRNADNLVRFTVFDTETWAILAQFEQGGILGELDENASNCVWTFDDSYLILFTHDPGFAVVNTSTWGLAHAASFPEKADTGWSWRISSRTAEISPVDPVMAVHWNGTTEDILVFSTDDWALLQSVSIPGLGGDSERSLAYSPDGSRLAVAGKFYPDPDTADPWLWVLETSGWGVQGDVQVGEYDPRFRVRTSWSPDGKYIATPCRKTGRPFKIFNAADLTLVEGHPTFDTNSGNVANFLPRGGVLALILDQHRDFVLLDTEDWSVLFRGNSLTPSYGQQSISFDGDSRVAVSGADHPYLLVYVLDIPPDFFWTNFHGQREIPV